MRFASLGSGSEGNGLLIESTDGLRVTRVLIDCGFSLSDTERRLRAAGVEPDSLDAVLVTHEHSDHVGGVFRLSAAHGVPVFLTHGTLLGSGKVSGGATLTLIDPLHTFEAGGFSIEPVAVPHDAREPVQYVIADGRVRLGVLTDIGHGTAHVQRAYSGLDALVLECNHDSRMLADNRRYPEMLKRRISGPYGHLSNQASADILASLDRSRLRTVVAAHLSHKNNTEDLARAALAGVLQSEAEAIAVADQDTGLHWLEV